jgi:hypothetical protein
MGAAGCHATVDGQRQAGWRPRPVCLPYTSGGEVSSRARPPAATAVKFLRRQMKLCAVEHPVHAQRTGGMLKLSTMPSQDRARSHAVSFHDIHGL